MCMTYSTHPQRVEDFHPAIECNAYKQGKHSCVTQSRKDVEWLQVIKIDISNIPQQLVQVCSTNYGSRSKISSFTQNACSVKLRGKSRAFMLRWINIDATVFILKTCSVFAPRR